MKKLDSRIVVKADMSPKAIDQRLRDWDGLFELAESLKKTKLVGKVGERQREKVPVSASAGEHRRPPHIPSPGH